MNEPIKQPEPCCAGCLYSRYIEEDDEEGDGILTCTNELQIYSLVDKTDYCYHFEYPF